MSKITTTKQKCFFCPKPTGFSGSVIASDFVYLHVLVLIKFIFSKVVIQEGRNPIWN